MSGWENRDQINEPQFRSLFHNFQHVIVDDFFIRDVAPFWVVTFANIFASSKIDISVTNVIVLIAMRPFVDRPFPPFLNVGTSLLG